MDIIHDEHSYINIFFRSMPFTLPLFIFFIFLYTKHIQLFYLILGSSSIVVITFVLKNFISYPIQQFVSYYTDEVDYPIIGRLSRPDGAKNSGLFYVSEDNYSSSLGMPSGHSISAAFIATYLYLYLIEKYKIENPEQTLMPICLIFTLYTMYSRVYIFKVHTIQQTIIGAYLGYILAIYYYKLVKRINPRYNDVINKVL